MAESLWVFEAKEFGPMIVAVDAHGKDLYQEVRRSAQKPGDGLKRAAQEARYLVDRGYPNDSAVRYVSDHHRLPEEQRFVLQRTIVSADTALARMAKALRLHALRGRVVFVDGYNTPITTESLLAGYPVYLCDDGFLRDTRGFFRSYKASQITVCAFSEILDLLAACRACSRRGALGSAN